MHFNEQQLALYTSGDTGFVQTLRLKRHLRNCTGCRQIVEEYRELTAALAVEPEIPNWNLLASEMKANIRLGLEAGACVQNRDRNGAEPKAFWNPRLAVAFASLVVLAGAGIALRQPKPAPPVAAVLAGQQIVKVDTEGVTITNVLFE